MIALFFSSFPKFAEYRSLSSHLMLTEHWVWYSVVKLRMIIAVMIDNIWTNTFKNTASNHGFTTFPNSFSKYNFINFAVTKNRLGCITSSDCLCPSHMTLDSQNMLMQLVFHALSISLATLFFMLSRLMGSLFSTRKQFYNLGTNISVNYYFLKVWISSGTL
jgi:hypothetical protein